MAEQQGADGPTFRPRAAASSSSFAPEGPQSSAFMTTPDFEEVRERVRLVEAKEAAHEAATRKGAAKLLFAGAVFGFLGFFFALLLGLIRERTTGKDDLNGNPFASGHGYFPATVSEMVHDPQKPEGKCFFAFCFIGALLIFFSYYPMHLRNVYTGDDTKGWFHLSWATYRQFIPAPGMMLLSIITVTPQAQADILDNICVALHLVAACALFIGYFITEAYCIGWQCCHRRIKHRVLETTAGKRQRQVCLYLICIFYVAFLLIQVVLSIGAPFYTEEESDQWGHLEGYKGVQLINTAGRKVKALKIASYGAEVLAGLSLIVSHLVIWYHCEERQYDLPEELDQLKSRLELVSNPKAAKMMRRRTFADGDHHHSDEESEDSSDFSATSSEPHSQDGLV